MNAKEIRQKSNDELKDLIKATKKRLLEIRFDLEGKKLKNVKEIKNLKKDIARILTITHNK